MLMLAYSALLTVASIVSAPWWLARMVATQRYRDGFKQRLGFVPAGLRAYGAGRKVVWLHAVSVGEVLAASRLIAELEAALGEGWRIVLSTTTRTGQTLAQERFGAALQGGDARVFYMPLDFAFAVRAYLHALQPAALILMESELWPRLLHECATRNIPMAVVNARLSDRSYRRAQRFRAVWSRVLRQPTLWLAQSDEDARRLHSCIDPAHPKSVILSEVARTCAKQSKDLHSSSSAITAQTLSGPRTRATPQIFTTGNLKYDIRAPKQSRAVDLILEMAGGRPVIVAGSTVGDSKSDEEYSLITAWGGHLRNRHNALLVLAPRHPERFSSAWQDATEFPAVKLTDLLLDKNTPPTGGFSTKPSLRIDIVLLDTIGDLSAVYAVAAVAFIGGSLLQRGGHNPLEAAQHAVPIVMGPSYENFRDVVQKMKDANGISIIGEAAGLSTASANAADSGQEDRFLVHALERELMRLLNDPPAARALGARGRDVFEQQQGATARTVDALLHMMRLPESTPPFAKSAKDGAPDPDPMDPTNPGAPYLDSEMRAATKAEGDS